MREEEVGKAGTGEGGCVKCGEGGGGRGGLALVREGV